MANYSLTVERLRELLHYDQETGFFTWLARPSLRSKRRAGDIAGYSSKKTGRAYVWIDGRSYLASRMAFLYMTGNFPLLHIDHKDINPSNDAWCNLREVTPTINMQNQRKALKRNKLGVLGVCKQLTRYQASIHVDGKEMYLGRFDTPEQAHATYLEAKRKFHPGCTL